jgi:ATP-dependent helicase HrpB
MEADLAPLLLELSAWGVSDPVGLSWLDPPPEAALGAARQLLGHLGALDGAGRITPLGSAMAALPLHPRQARLLLRARELGCPSLGCDLAALVSERDIYRIQRGDFATHSGVSDISDRLECLQGWLVGGSSGQGDRTALKGVERVSRQLERLVASSKGQTSPLDQEDAVARLLLAAYPDRLARRRDGGDGRYQLTGGRGARLSPRSVVKNAEYIVAVDVDAGGEGEGIIHLASSVSLEKIRQELAPLIGQQSSVTWSEREGRVVSLLEQRVGAVSLSTKPYAATSGELMPVVLEAVRASRLKLLNLDEGVRQLQGRVALLRRAYPDQGWSDLVDDRLLESLDEWLAPHLSGVRTAQDLAALDVAAAVGTLLDYRQKRDLDDLAPTHLTVPSGSRIRLDYTDGDLPVLAVKLQELFGLAETPTVAGGRVAVLLHLLSPAGRPIQVTQDLKGFWNGAYHQVKKELKGRYPKHPWPDDPWSAQPTRRAKPRGT